jgi:uncharacterized protein (TIGR02246 family)
MTMRLATTIGIALVMWAAAPNSRGAQTVAPGTVDPAIRHAIQQTWDGLVTALRQKDAAAIARAWTADGDHSAVVPDARLRSGRAEIEEMWVGGLPGLPARERHATLRAVRLLRPDVALVDGTLESGPATTPDGIKMPSGREPFFAVMVKEGSRWLINATRMGATVRDTQ